MFTARKLFKLQPDVWSCSAKRSKHFLSGVLARSAHKEYVWDRITGHPSSSHNAYLNVMYCSSKFKICGIINHKILFSIYMIVWRTEYKLVLKLYMFSNMGFDSCRYTSGFDHMRGLVYISEDLLWSSFSNFPSTFDNI